MIARYAFNRLKDLNLAEILSADPMLIIESVPPDVVAIEEILAFSGAPLVKSYQDSHRTYDEVKSLPEPKRDPNSEIIQSTSSDLFFPHTDGAFMEQPYRFMALYSEHNSVEGGNSIALTRDQVFQSLTDSEREFFVAEEYDFGVKPYPIFGASEEVSTIRFNIAHIRKAIGAEGESGIASRKLEKANALADKIVQLSNEFQFRLEQGSLLLMDNWRTLHGRFEFDPGSGSRVFWRFRTAGR